MYNVGFYCGVVQQCVHVLVSIGCEIELFLYFRIGKFKPKSTSPVQFFLF